MKPFTLVSGAVSTLLRDDVDTDQIIPKQFLRRIERTGFGAYLFWDWRQQPGWSLEANPILVTGRNFGCGSSREHAPWALEDFGFRAIVAPSFADIFFANCTKIGLLPVQLAESEVAEIARRGHATVDLETQSVDEFSFEFDPEIKHKMINGLDEIALTLERLPAIERYERSRKAASRLTDADPPAA